MLKSHKMAWEDTGDISPIEGEMMTEDKVPKQPHQPKIVEVPSEPDDDDEENSPAKALPQEKVKTHETVEEINASSEKEKVD